MVSRYREGKVPKAGVPTPADQPLIALSEGLLDKVDAAIEAFEVDRAIARIWDLVREANRYVVTEAPWELVKQATTRSEDCLSAVLYNLVEVLRLIAGFSSPFIPSTARRIASIFSLPGGWDRLSVASTKWGRVQTGGGVTASEPLFPKN